MPRIVIPTAQIRARGTNDHSYSPLRDIAVLFPRLMEAARQSLEAGKLEPWAVAFFNQFGLDEKDLAEAYLACARAVAESLRWNADHPSVALEEQGFFSAPPAAKLAVFARLGMATLSLSHHYMRASDQSPVDAEHHARDLASMVDEAERFVRDAAARCGR